MGDRTSYTIAVAGTDPAEDNYIDRLLADAFEAESSSDGAWVLYEWSVGQLDEIAEVLNRAQAELDNAFAFRIWEDPKYEWDGAWSGWIPGLGGASGLCDGNGTPHVDSSDIDRVVDRWERIRGSLAELVDALRRLTDREWELAWKALRP